MPAVPPAGLRAPRVWLRYSEGGRPTKSLRQALSPCPRPARALNRRASTEDGASDGSRPQTSQLGATLPHCPVTPTTSPASEQPVVQGRMLL